ncbi:MAG: FAD-dependent oxidoreductase, partial [Pseudomonadales bacterium]|nr:FAD-dependent oxidoreductase [Pseudomonadales bacterium]
MDVIVIGAGLIGITSAYFLNQAGHKVKVIDRAEAPGMETSFANGSMITAYHSRPWNGPGVFTDLIRWLGKEDAPMLIRPTALPQYFF